MLLCALGMVFSQRPCPWQVRANAQGPAGCAQQYGQSFALIARELAAAGEITLRHILSGACMRLPTRPSRVYLDTSARTCPSPPYTNFICNPFVISFHALRTR